MNFPPPVRSSESSSPRRILIAFNPHAGAIRRQQTIEELRESLQTANFEVTVCSEIPEISELTSRYLETRELRGVVAAGGDGTFALVANQLSQNIPLAAFPLGTENLLARYLGHRASCKSLVDLMKRGQAIPFDAGQANGRLFLLMAGCGFDAEVVDRAHRSRRGHITRWSYLKPLWDTVRSYAYPKLLLRLPEVDGKEEPIECCWAFVVNVPRYALGLCFDRDASPCDGELNVVAFREGSLAKGLQYFFSVLRGSHRRRDDVTVRKTCSLRVESVEPAKFQLDGDPGGDLPLDIRCLANRLNVLVAPEWIAQNLNATDATTRGDSLVH